MEKTFKEGEILLRCEGFLPVFSFKGEEPPRPYFEEYRISKLTPTGMWVVPRYYPAKPKFQKKEKCRFASKTKAEAVLAFQYRRRAWLRILNNNISRAQQGLADATDWLNRTKLEIDPVTTASD